MLQLRPDVTAVRIGDEVVFLDAVGDSYTALSDPDRALRLTAGSARLEVSEPALLRELESAGLVGSGPSRAVRVAAPAVRAVALATPGRPSLADVAAFAVAVAWTAARSRGISLAVLLAWAARRRPGGSAASAERLADIWARLMIWSPWQGDCLFRSHLLLRFLRLRGADADWVFAVRTWPFAAHCWLQVDGVVLNDRPEVLTAFSPIRAA